MNCSHTGDIPVFKKTANYLSHASAGIREGILDITEVLDQKTIGEVSSIMQNNKESFGDLHRSLNGKYSYGVLSMVHAHMERKKEP